MANFEFIKHIVTPEEEKRWKHDSTHLNMYELYCDGKRFDNHFYLYEGFFNLDQFNLSLRTKRYVTLYRLKESKFTDYVMKSSHGKDWKKTESPYNLLDYQFTILDTKEGKFVWSSESCRWFNAYCYIYDNIIAFINKDKIWSFYKLATGEFLKECKGNKIHTKKHIIVGGSTYGWLGDTAYLINPKTCEIQEIE